MTTIHWWEEKGNWRGIDLRDHKDWLVLFTGLGWTTGYWMAAMRGKQ